MSDNLHPMARAYIDCALWSSTDEDGDPLDDWATIDDVDPATLAAMVADCDDFRAAVDEAGIPLDGWTDEQTGHDFWLTRNRHGAGFWDRYYGPDDPRAEAGDRLTALAHAYGETWLYVGDDGTVYHS